MESFINYFMAIAIMFVAVLHVEETGSGSCILDNTDPCIVCTIT